MLTGGSPARALVVAGAYFPEIGGGERLSVIHAWLLRRCGYDVTVLVPRRGIGGIDALGTPYAVALPLRLANYRAVPPRTLARELETRQPALVYFIGPHPQDFYGVRMVQRRGIPVAALYHADFRVDRVSSRAITEIYARMVSRRLDAVCTTTEGYRQRLIARGVDPGRIHDVGMGVDAASFAPGLPRRERSGAILFVGGMGVNHTYKRFDLLLDALAALRAQGRRYTLRAIGDGESRARFERQAESLGIGPSVAFTGTTDDAGLLAAYRAADVLVLPSPSEAEGYGMVVLEALACGCPVVTSAIAGAGEAVKASGCGALWNGIEASDLARAIDQVLTAPTPRDRVAEAAREYVLASHTWERVGDRLCSALLSARRRVA